jgi:hypothetical protein
MMKATGSWDFCGVLPGLGTIDFIADVVVEISIILNALDSE